MDTTVNYNSFKMSGKFIITITGPIMMYRLDLIKRASPSIIKNNIIIFTDDFSLKIYKEKGYDKDFNFVSMDEIRKNYPISLKHHFFEFYKKNYYIVIHNIFYLLFNYSVRIDFKI